MNIKKRSILVIAITRMGDLLQSVPFLECLKAKNSDADIHILVEDCFYDVAAMLPHVSVIHSVRLEDLLPNLSSVLSRSNLAKSLDYYSRFVKSLNDNNFSQVWNLTHTRPSMHLNYLLAKENGCGVTLDKHGFQKVNSPWLKYFFATNLTRPWCQFNLVDIYANAISQETSGHKRKLSIKPLSSFTSGKIKSTNQNIRKIAIHTGASQAAKQWPVKNFEKLINLLSSDNMTVILVGSNKDAQTAEYLSQRYEVENKVGSTNPRELAELLAGCDLLISNDSGPMHIAAAVNTKVIALTVGTALGSETAPYGENHWVIEPDTSCFPCDSKKTLAGCNCSEKISAELVNEIVRYELFQQKKINTDYLTGASVYQTKCDSRTGMQRLKRCFTREDSLRDKLNYFIAPYWKAMLDKQQIPESSGCAQISEEVYRLACAAESDITKILKTINEMIADTREKSVNVISIKMRAERLDQEEKQLENRLTSHAFLKSIYAYLQISKASLSASELNGQLDETKTIYTEIASLIKALAGNKKEENTNHISNKKDFYHENQDQRVIPA